MFLIALHVFICLFTYFFFLSKNRGVFSKGGNSDFSGICYRNLDIQLGGLLLLFFIRRCFGGAVEQHEGRGLQCDRAMRRGHTAYPHASASLVRGGQGVCVAASQSLRSSLERAEHGIWLCSGAPSPQLVLPLPPMPPVRLWLTQLFPLGWQVRVPPALAPVQRLL